MWYFQEQWSHFECRCMDPAGHFSFVRHSYLTYTWWKLKVKMNYLFLSCCKNVAHSCFAMLLWPSHRTADVIELAVQKKMMMMRSSWVNCLQTQAMLFRFFHWLGTKRFSLMLMMIFKMFSFQPLFYLVLQRTICFNLRNVLNMIDMSYPTTQCTYGGIPGSRAQSPFSICFIFTFHPSPL